MKNSTKQLLRNIEEELALKQVTVLSRFIQPEVLRAIFPEANLCVLKHVCVSVNARQQLKQIKQQTTI